MVKSAYNFLGSGKPFTIPEALIFVALNPLKINFLKFMSLTFPVTLDSTYKVELGDKEEVCVFNCGTKVSRSFIVILLFCKSILRPSNPGSFTMASNDGKVIEAEFFISDPGVSINKLSSEIPVGFMLNFPIKSFNTKPLRSFKLAEWIVANMVSILYSNLVAFKERPEKYKCE